MTAATASWWNPPPAPERDLWWHAQRIAAPDADDHTARHRRGYVRLPYDLGGEGLRRAGDLVPAWVCCDPSCSGVELGDYVLELNHGCCTPRRYVSDKPWKPARRHTVGLGRVNHPGYYHGPYTAYWQPDQA